MVYDDYFLSYSDARSNLAVANSVLKTLTSAAEGNRETVLEIALNLAKENVSELDEYLKRGVYGK